MEKAKKTLLDVHKIDIEKVTCLISEDDTALQPRLDVKVFKK